MPPEQIKSSINKFVNNLLVKFACDNLDARLVANTVRLVDKILDWHGTIRIASQMPTAPLIETGRNLSALSWRAFLQRSN